MSLLNTLLFILAGVAHIQIYARIQLGNDIVGTQSYEQSGYSLSLSSEGNVVAIGSPYFDSSSTTDVGRVRVFEYNSNTWSPRGSDMLGTQHAETFGVSVSLNSEGTILAVGSNGFDTSATDVGRVRVFEFSGSRWLQRGSDILGSQRDEQSGYSVSLSSEGNVVAIGSYGFDTSTNDEGRVRVFEFSGSRWFQIGIDILGTQSGEQSGYSVSLSSDGTAVAVGSRYFSTISSGVGRGRVFRYAGSRWSQQGSDMVGTQSDEQSGYSVSLSHDGRVVAIQSTSVGVRVFAYSGSIWSQRGNFDSVGIVGGFHVAISGDGLSLIVINKLFSWDGKSWIQRGRNVVEDTSLSAVAISSDGTKVAIGDSMWVDRYFGKVQTFEVHILSKAPVDAGKEAQYGESTIMIFVVEFVVLFLIVFAATICWRFVSRKAIVDDPIIDDAHKLGNKMRNIFKIF